MNAPSSRQRRGWLVALLAGCVGGTVCWFAFRPSPDRFTPIDLMHHYNEELHVSCLPDDDPRNSLSSLPRGRHTYLGIPFDARGKIQLAGQVWRNKKHRFPVRAESIPVRSTCRKLHLLHANCGAADPPGTAVALLVLHYRGGEVAEIELRQDEHLMDWWAWNPHAPTDPDTQVAWTGDNPVAIRDKKTLRLFRSTLANPHPEQSIEALDYVSAMANSAPFLVALTIER